MKFPPVVKEKLSDVVTKSIKDAILQGKMKPGEKIPTEHELVEQFQVSRIVVREALKNLEAIGLLVIKRGSGMFVAEAGTKTTTDAFLTALVMQHVDMEEITEARIHIEPMIVALAAKKRTTANLNNLNKNIKETQKLIDSKKPAKSKNIEFHILISECTQNKAIMLSIQALLYSLEQLDPPRDGYPKRDSAALRFHKELFETIKKKDSEQAMNLMREHLVSVQKLHGEST